MNKTHQFHEKERRRSYDYDWDMVLVFPYTSDDKEEGIVDQKYSRDAFVNLMLGLRSHDILEELSCGEKIIQNKQQRILRTRRCFLDDSGHRSSIRSVHKTNEDSKSDAEFLEDCKKLLREEYKAYVGSPESTTASIFCRLIATSIARRLQLACGLTTHMFYAMDGEGIICTIRADNMDLRVEAERIGYHLQTRNKPFSNSHHELNNKFNSLHPLHYEESIRHLRKIRGAPTKETMPELDPLLITKGKKHHPQLIRVLERWGHNEQVDDDDGGKRVSLLLNNKKEKSKYAFKRWLNELLFISHDPLSYFSAFAAYKMEGKFQPYFRRYSLSNDTKEKSLFRQVDRIRLVDSIITRHIGIDAMILNKVLINYFCLHNNNDLESLKKNWALNFLTLTQPLVEIRNYFGEKVALYFAWLQFYTQSLCLPSLLGIFIFCLDLFGGVGTASGFEGMILIGFSIGIVIWATLFNTMWERKNAIYNCLWGIQEEQTIQEQSRAQFIGKLRNNPINDNKEIWYINLKERQRKIILSVFVILMMIFIVIIALIGLFYLKFIFQDHILFSHLVPVMNAIEIMLLNSIYKKVAISLNNWENHRTQTEYENFLVTKVFCFQFVNSFASFFYIAFLKKSLEGQCLENNCFTELRQQLYVLLLVRILVGNFTEVGIPYIQYRIKLYFRKWKEPIENKYLDSEKQIKLSAYEQDESFEDYNELVIQYGFITLFVAVFPLTPLLALINNLLEVHVDSIKLCFGHRRPFPHQAKNIGAWMFFLKLMSNVSIITNCALLLFTSDLFQDLSLSQRWIIFILAEHICFIIKILLDKSISKIPTHLTELLQRYANIENMVFKGHCTESTRGLVEKAEELDLAIHSHPLSTEEESEMV